VLDAITKCDIFVLLSNFGDNLQVVLNNREEGAWQVECLSLFGNPYDFLSNAENALDSGDLFFGRHIECAFDKSECFGNDINEAHNCSDGTHYLCHGHKCGFSAMFFLSLLAAQMYTHAMPPPRDGAPHRSNGKC
jgi:hypothetical protein